MARRRKDGPGAGWLFVVFVLVIGGIGAAAYYMTDTAKSKPEPTGGSAVVVEEPSRDDNPAQRDVVIYLPKQNDTDTWLAPVTRTLGPEGGILDGALSVLLRAGQKTDINLIPEGARLLSPVKIRRGIAVVNLSSEFADNFSGGSDLEALTLNSIAHTLVKNSGGRVRGVLLMVAGKPIESLGGHFDLTEPITADSTLLGPGAKN